MGGTRPSPLGRLETAPTPCLLTVVYDPSVRVLFLGTPAFAAESLSALLASSHDVVGVVAQPDRKAGRGLKLHRPEVAQLAEKNDIPLLQPHKIRTEDFLEAIKGFEADIGVVVAYGRILPDSLLEVPRHGFINVHASILPFYRGAAPIQRAIENGDEETGVTIMQVDSELDHGAVFSIARTPIDPNEHTPALAERLARLGGNALVEVLDQIETATASSTSQEHDHATVAPKIEKRESIVEWSESAKTIFDRYRAFDPWPGVSIEVGGQAIRLTQIDLDSATGSPGTILALEEESLVVAVGTGSLRLTRVQRPGKGPVSAADFARGLKLKIGSRLS